MIKIAHTSDTHIGEYPGPVERGQNLRLRDILVCMQYFRQQCQQEQPDLIVHAGDLTNKSKLWADQANKETQYAIDWLRQLTEIAPVVLLMGTLNHDNIEAFRILERMRLPNLYVCTRPELLTIPTRYGTVQVAAVPGFEKNYFRAQFPGLSAEEENAACTQALHDIILGLGAQIDPQHPSILLSHYTIIGCQYDNGNHVFAANEVVINQATLEASPFDLVAMGHIHIAQRVPSPTKSIYYAGTLQGITFNEEGQDKGFWMHDLHGSPRGWLIGSRFIKTPAREFLTINLDQEAVELAIENSIVWDVTQTCLEEEEQNKYSVKDRIVRVKYECDEETNKIFNRNALEKQLYNAGAFYVAEITPEKIRVTTEKKAMDENRTPEENLLEYLNEKKVPEEEIGQIMEIARPLIATAEARTTAGKLVGMFEPISLEVKNYRSFWEERFDFDKITFATVNGENGNGKSAFFMDAIATCLYEETRSGDLTSWICNDPTNPARSGSIIFTFKIGDTKWRVTRTRTKGGKVTLNLSEEVNNSWENRSEEKTPDTQDKIIKLLGMDALTFKCCALIMQDQYGLFLQADKEDRMKVLADILGLGIYEELEDMTKKRITDENRELLTIKKDIETLQESIAVKDQLEADKAQHIGDNNRLIEAIGQDKEAVIEATKEIIKMQNAKAKADEITQEIEQLKTKATDQETTRTSLQKQIADAQIIVAGEQTIIAKVKEYNEAVQQQTTLKALEPVLKDKEGSFERITKEMADNIKEKAGVQQQLETAQKIIDNEANINIKVKEYDETKTKITELKTKQAQLAPKENEQATLTQEFNNLGTSIIETEAQINEATELLDASATILEKAQEYDKASTDLDDMDAKAKKYFKLQQEVQELSSEKTRIEEKGTGALALLRDKIANLSLKAAMLGDSNCIDPQNAKCVFLADAIEAKRMLEIEQKNFEQLEAQVAQDNAAALKAWKDKTAERDAVGFDDEKHKALKATVIALKPYYEKAAKLDGTRKALELLNNKATDEKARWQQIADRLKALEKEIVALKAELQELPGLEAKMPELQKWINARDKLPAARETLTQGNERIKFLDDAGTIKNDLLQAISNEIATIKAKMEPLPELEKKIQELAIYTITEKELPAAKQTIKMGTAQVETITKDLADIAQQISKRQQDHAEQITQTEFLTLAEESVASLKADIEAKEETQNILLQQLGSINQRLQIIADDIKKITALTEKQTQQAHKVNILQKIAQAWSPDGIPFNIVRNILPELTVIANNILGQMTGGKMAIEFKTDKVLKSNKSKEVNVLEVLITDVQHGTLPYMDKSGGQRVKTALASVLGLAEIKRSRAGMQLAMLFIDEPPFLDDGGKQAYIDALEVISSRYIGTKIIAITHELEMKARFPQAIEVTATDEGSKIIFN